MSLRTGLTDAGGDPLLFSSQTADEMTNPVDASAYFHQLLPTVGDGASRRTLYAEPELLASTGRIRSRFPQKGSSRASQPAEEQSLWLRRIRADVDGQA
jgi:hypothetical protein